MNRLLFKKTGNAIWISHLDLMRLFQRAFRRAGLPLTHTQGFNPRPSVSIALPLSVGVSSDCELLDFSIDGVEVPCDEIKRRLNESLTDGIEVLEVYQNGRKIRDLTHLHTIVTMEYDNGIPEGAVSALQALLERDTLVVPKKTKSGVQDQDIIPMIKELKVIAAGEKEINLDAVVCCQNPTLNPMQLPLAVEMHTPEFAPDFSKCCRIEIYDKQGNVFR